MHPTPDRATPTAARRRLALASAALLALPLAAAQGDVDPAEVVVARLGDATVTLEAFDRRFEAAVRATLAQQGVEADAAALAAFATERPGFLRQLGEELVLGAHAADLGVAVPDDEVDAVVAQAKEEFGDGLEAAVAEVGYGSIESFRVGVRRSLDAQRAVQAIQADVVVDDAAIEAWYEANPEQVAGPDGATPLAEVREPIAALLASELVQERIAALMAASPLELHPDRL